MAFSTREIESPDPVTRVAAADVTARENLGDIGEKMVLNMGPSHPATHGVLRLVLELDGEIITKAIPDVGYLHRGDEKIAETMQYNQFVPYTDRLDYLAPLANNVAYALAVEKLMGWDLPPRGKAIRVICCETARISSHLLGLHHFLHPRRRPDSRSARNFHPGAPKISRRFHPAARRSRQTPDA